MNTTTTTETAGELAARKCREYAARQASGEKLNADEMSLWAYYKGRASRAA